MARETWVQSQVESYQRLKNWYLMHPCLTLSIIRYGSRVKRGNLGKGVAPSPTPCSSYRKGNLRVTLDYGRQQLTIIIIIIIIIIRYFHISNSRWFFSEVWVTASLLKSPGLFLVFWQFSTMLSFGWSPLVRQPPSPLVPLVIP